MVVFSICIELPVQIETYCNVNRGIDNALSTNFFVQIETYCNVNNNNNNFKPPKEAVQIETYCNVNEENDLINNFADRFKQKHTVM